MKYDFREEDMNFPYGKLVVLEKTNTKVVLKYWDGSFGNNGTFLTFEEINNKIMYTEHTPASPFNFGEKDKTESILLFNGAPVKPMLSKEWWVIYYALASVQAASHFVDDEVFSNMIHDMFDYIETKTSAEGYAPRP